MTARASVRTPRIAMGVPAAGVLAAALVGLLPADSAAQSGYGTRWAGVTRETPADAALRALADELRSGGYTLLCRHAITDPNATDSGPAHEQQRNLNESGRAQARRMGRSIASAGIPVADVRASPRWRTMDTAELAFERVRAEPLLRGPVNRDALSALLENVPDDGNRVLVSHQGVIRHRIKP